MRGSTEAECMQRGKAVSRAGTLSKPRGEESLLVAGVAEKEEDGRRRTVGLCSGHPDALVSQGNQAHISRTPTLGAGCSQLSYSCLLVLRFAKIANLMNSEAIGILPPLGSHPIQLSLQP